MRNLRPPYAKQGSGYIQIWLDSETELSVGRQELVPPWLRDMLGADPKTYGFMETRKNGCSPRNAPNRENRRTAQQAEISPEMGALRLQTFVSHLGRRRDLPGILCRGILCNLPPSSMKAGETLEKADPPDAFQEPSSSLALVKSHHCPDLLSPRQVPRESRLLSPADLLAPSMPYAAVNLHHRRPSPEPYPDLNGTGSGRLPAWFRRLINPPFGCRTITTLPRPAGHHRHPLAAAGKAIAGKAPALQTMADTVPSSWISFIVLMGFSKPNLLWPNWEMVLHYICPASGFLNPANYSSRWKRSFPPTIFLILSGRSPEFYAGIFKVTFKND
ncbi:unnamed protein product [Arabis nemorensis]|uniref:Uncharacterized protein n=1 Tax=Arabis nemorensis TaxID=586526 RepID=A0A565AST8_9BRAS|nr:unnamed protein product [Arabis nemorensis]